MPRVDVWDVPANLPEKQVEPLWVGFTRAKVADRYDVGKELGHGGFGNVRVVIERGTGKEYACKSIIKRLSVPNVSTTKQNQHLENIRREALILRRLRGTLNVVHLEDVFEDEEAVHMVMEWCKGGELVHRINTRHYSERTAASYMRAVLRTLAQCHHLRILHRDIKPGNFMLLTDADNAPVKAIDFGLAVFFDPKKLPRTDLGLEGTPHFMAPEQLSGKTEPASDIWSAGVMAHQLLCGCVPFDDTRNPRAPALSLVWRAILTEEPRFTQRSWTGVSELAKDFVRSLLRKDPKQRPTAKQALAHPWLQGKSDQRNQGAPLARTVVQRLQKFGVESALKRTVLDMIANDLINRHIEELKQQQQLQQQQPQQGQQQSDGSQHAAGATGDAALGAGPAGVDAGEATPQGAAAAAAAGSPLPPPDAATGLRLRQLAAQDLLLRASGGGPMGPKHATVHAGGEALAALRRGQLLGLPRPPSLAALQTAQVRVPPQAQPQPQVLPNPQAAYPPRRSNDLGPRPLLVSASGAGSGGGSGGGLHQRASTGLGMTHTQAQPPSDPQQQQQQLAGATVPVTSPFAAAPKPHPPVPHPPPSLPSRHSAGAPSPGAVPPGSTPLGMPRSPSWQRIARTAAAAAAASANNGSIVGGVLASSPGGGGGGGSYKGPVRDLAAATAWDLGFMATRLAQEGGSGHALHHYARLLGGVGERSLHGVRERSYHAGGSGSSPQAPLRQHSPTTSPLQGPTAATAADGTGDGSGSTNAEGGDGSAAGGAATSPGGTPGGDYLRMLSLVARQRAEQRKVQRLSLDTSGHRQSHYGKLMAAEADGTAAPAAEAARDMTPPPEDEGEGEDEGDDGATSTTSVSVGGEAASMPAAATGMVSSPAPSPAPAATSAHVSAAALPPPSPTQLQRRSVTPQAPLSGDSAARSPAAAPAPAGPFATSAAAIAAAAAAAASPLPPHRSPKPNIPGLEEADAQSLCSGAAGLAATPTPSAMVAGGGAGRTGSDGAMSYCSSSALGGTDEGADPLAALQEGEEGGEEQGGEADGGGGEKQRSGEEVKRSSLLRRVRKALMKPVKTLLGSNTGTPAGAKHAAVNHRAPSATSDGARSGTATPASSAGGTGTGSRTPMGPRSGQLPLLDAAAAALAGGGAAAGGGAGGSRALSTLSVSSVATPTEERGRGRGAYAALMQHAASGTNTPLERSGHGAADRSAHSDHDRSVRGGRDRSSANVDVGAAAPAAAAVPGPAGVTIHTVKAHREPLPASGAVVGRGAGSFISPPTVPVSAPSAAAAAPAAAAPAATAAAPAAAAPAAAASIGSMQAAAGPGAAAALQPVAGLPTGGKREDVGGEREGPAVKATAAGRHAEAVPSASAPVAVAAAAPDGADSAVAGATKEKIPSSVKVSDTAACIAAGGAGIEAAPGAAAEVPKSATEPVSDETAAAAAAPMPEAVAGPVASAAPTARTSVRHDELAPALGLLLGDAGRVAELQEVMRRLQYDRAAELTVEQLCEGLQWLGYRLEPSEVEDLLRQVSVGANEGLTASQFIASQADWRAFQANHRSQWMECLRKAFEELGGGADRVTVDQLVAALNDKLPEEEVNLAVQDSLMDAAVEADAMDFDAFVKLMRCNSGDSLASGASSELSYDLYDPRLKDASLHGPLGEGSHYQPALETVPDDQE